MGTRKPTPKHTLNNNRTSTPIYNLDMYREYLLIFLSIGTEYSADERHKVSGVELS
jgi:hypothetical protein